MDNLLAIIALILGALGSFYAIFIGKKPLKDYCLEYTKYMWWSKCIGTKRIEWLEKRVSKTDKEVPLEDQAIRTWNIICHVIDTTNLNTINEKESEVFKYCLSMCCHNLNSNENFAPQQCRIGVGFGFKLIDSMTLDAHLHAWELIKYIIENCCSTALEMHAKRYYKSLKYLEDLINCCTVLDDKLVVIAEIVCTLRERLFQDRKLYPSRITNDANIAFLKEAFQHRPFGHGNFDRLTLH